MTIDGRIRDEKLQYDIKKKQQKYRHYHQLKLINMNILQVKKLLPPDQSRIIEKAKFTYSPLSRAF